MINQTKGSTVEIWEGNPVQQGKLIEALFLEGGGGGGTEMDLA